MKKIFLSMLIMISCKQDVIPDDKGLWLKVKASNYQVLTPSNTYREIVFDFTISKDSLQKELVDLPLSISAVVLYNNKEYQFELPPNEATVRFGANILVTDTLVINGYKIVKASYPDPTLKINY